MGVSGPMPTALAAFGLHVLLAWGGGPALAAPLGERAATASAKSSASAAELPPLGIAAPEVLYEADTPPRTKYDALEETNVLTPESHSLVAQLGRTVVSLLLVVALIYLTMKVLLPKFINRLPQRGASAHLKMVERLQLDTTHQIFLVDVHEGPRVLLGTSESGVQMLQSWAPRAQDAFRGRMLQTPNPLPNDDPQRDDARVIKDEGHAPN